MELPNVEGAEYLVSLLSELGLATTNGMGTFPISWQELESWIRCTGLELTVWEKLTIKLLSETYTSELHKSTSPAAPPPYVKTPEPMEVDRKSVADRLRNALRPKKRKSGDEETK